ncbi:photosystem II stability/assembly factor-like uncharacterized protein [Oxalobacteraceae bacterium GrIS 2.11]
MKLAVLCFILCLTSLVFADTMPNWSKQTSLVGARLRGVSAVNDKVAWASGSGNTVLRTVDGGTNWNKIILPDSTTPLDFRDIKAIDAQTVYVLSIGEASSSRIYKTSDAGQSWTRQYTNPDPQGFLDSMAFWDARHGLVVGDAIGDRLQILTTSNGGAGWTKIPDTALPKARPNEGAFSASGSNIATFGSNDAWIALNSVDASRVLHSGDRGKTWTWADSPLACNESAGIFSITFRDALHGVIVGGDYKKETAAIDNVAITSDGGKSWKLVRKKGLSGFRSAVKYIPNTAATLIAVGPSGADISRDDGQTWEPLSYPDGVSGFDALSFAAGRSTAWASGDQGALARLNFR